MKSILNIFLDQLRSKEIWKRFLELNNLKRNDDPQYSYKARIITKEDIPALVITFSLAIFVTAMLKVFVSDRYFTRVAFGIVVLFTAMGRAIQKRPKTR